MQCGRYIGEGDPYFVTVTRMELGQATNEHEQENH